MSGSGGIAPSFRSSSASGSGQSRFSSTSTRDRRAMSACSIRLSRSFDVFIVSAPASAFSRSPYSTISLVAVFGPTPRTPGTLSTLSPISASTSPTRSGATPNFSFTASSPMPDILHRVEHVDVRRRPRARGSAASDPCPTTDDGDVPPCGDRRLGIAGDQIVGLIAPRSRCTAAKRRASRRGSAGIAGADPRAVRAGSPYTGRKSRCGTTC